ncbi:MAG: tyrosine-type recombinase/integrase [Rubrivivax sp.]|nr:tyrosine-type recombinase/integrase [Rubrivivax sp.]
MKNGTRPLDDFDAFADAKDWIAKTLAEATTEHMPELGGPVKATLAQALVHYAGLNSITKRGVDGELNRINHYLAGTDMPLLRTAKDEKGATVLETYKPKPQPPGWQAHNDRRRSLRSKTYQAMAELGRMRCSTITTAELRRFMTTMQKEGLSDSTIQKEIALLRAMFNVTIKEWKWTGFESPTLTLKLGKSAARFVFLTPEQEQALWQAVGKCDNPYFWPLVVCGLETTMRKGSLLAMRWDKTDLVGRVAQVPSKTGPVMQPLSKHIVIVLSDMPRDASGMVFPMTKNAVQEAWKGARDNALVPWLQFKDVRHLGATEYARRGVGAQALRKILGHKTTHMADIYVNLAASDVLNAMDSTAKVVPVIQIPPPAVGTAADIVNGRRSARLVKALEVRMSALRSGVDVDANGRSASESEPQLKAHSKASPGQTAAQLVEAGGKDADAPLGMTARKPAPRRDVPAASQKDLRPAVPAEADSSATPVATVSLPLEPLGGAADDDTAPMTNVVPFKRRPRVA